MELSFTWQEVEDLLLLLAATEVQRNKVPILLSALRKMQDSASRLDVLRYVLVGSWMVQAETADLELQEIGDIFRVH